MKAWQFLIVVSLVFLCIGSYREVNSLPIFWHATAFIVWNTLGILLALFDMSQRRKGSNDDIHR